jgi:hypothetical protein
MLLTHFLYACVQSLFSAIAHQLHINHIKPRGIAESAKTLRFCAAEYIKYFYTDSTVYLIFWRTYLQVYFDIYANNYSYRTFYCLLFLRNIKILVK